MIQNKKATFLKLPPQTSKGKHKKQVKGPALMQVHKNITEVHNRPVGTRPPPHMGPNKL